jgi:hypothetical protein
MKDPKDTTTTPLPPSSPIVEEEPVYDNVEEIILELWEFCLRLEYEYYKTNDRQILIEFTFCIGLIQYWEDVYFSTGGRYGIQVRF